MLNFLIQEVKIYVDKKQSEMIRYRVRDREIPVNIPNTVVKLYFVCIYVRQLKYGKI